MLKSLWVYLSWAFQLASWLYRATFPLATLGRLCHHEASIYPALLSLCSPSGTAAYILAFLVVFYRSLRLCSLLLISFFLFLRLARLSWTILKCCLSPSTSQTCYLLKWNVRIFFMFAVMVEFSILEFIIIFISSWMLVTPISWGMFFIFSVSYIISLKSTEHI